MNLLWNVPKLEKHKSLDYTTNKTGGSGWRTTKQLYTDVLLFHFSPLLILFQMSQKTKFPLSVGKFSQRCRNIPVHIILDPLVDSPVLFQVLTNIIIHNLSSKMVVPFLLIRVHWNEKCQLREIKRVKTKIQKFQVQKNHKFKCYPKSLLIITSYQLQGWLIIIKSPVNF